MMRNGWLVRWMGDLTGAGWTHHQLRVLAHSCSRLHGLMLALAGLRRQQVYRQRAHTAAGALRKEEKPTVGQMDGGWADALCVSLEFSPSRSPQSAGRRPCDYRLVSQHRRCLLDRQSPLVIHKQDCIVYIHFHQRSASLLFQLPSSCPPSFSPASS